MPGPEDADDRHLLDIAAAISRGERVDWNAARQAPLDDEDSTALVELQALEGLTRFNAPASTWGPFDIEGEIGHGSFGTVYAAVDRNLQVPVALKVIRPREPAAIHDAARAFREARLLAQINHPHVVRVYRADEVGGEVGVAMELIKGVTLLDLLRVQGPLDARETAAIGGDLCRALAAVHGVGMVHGDINARNVMREEGGRTVLMDFGASALSPADGSRAADRIAATSLYLAPERFSGSAPTVASDIYSLGVLLFHLLTNDYPVNGKSHEEIERQHAAGAPLRRVLERRPDLPPSLADAVDRAIARAPAARHATAAAFGAALDASAGSKRSPWRLGWSWNPTAGARVGSLLSRWRQRR